MAQFPDFILKQIVAVDPNAGAGTAGLPNEFLIRTDVPSLYFLPVGAGPTGWVQLGSGGGGGGGGGGWFGSAIDGNVVAPAAYTVTDGLDEYYGNLTIPAAGTFFTNSMRLFVDGTLTMGANSLLHCRGNNGVLQASGAEGNSANGIIGYGLAGTGGAGPGNGNGGAGAGLLSTGLGTPSRLVTAGGAGGGSGAFVGGAGGTNGVGGDVTRRIDAYQIDAAIRGGENYFQGAGRYCAGGMGGGGGGSSGGTATGGGGGGGGGVMVLFARRIVADPTARVSVRGGIGGNGVTGTGTGGGGGGGGGGGVLFVASQDTLATWTPIVEIAGGAGGAGAGIGLAGGVGGNGALIFFQT